MHKITQKHLGILLSQMGGSIAIDAPTKNCFLVKKLGPYNMGHFYLLDNITYKKKLYLWSDICIHQSMKV